MNITLTKSSRAPTASPGQQQGFTLIEVLVAVIILSTGILGMMALQTTSMKTNQSSYYRTQAVIVAYDMIDRMRANPLGVTAGLYDAIDSTAAGSVPSCVATGCSSADRAAMDIAQWGANFDSTNGIFPQGQGSVDINPDNTFSVNISWHELDWDNTAVGIKTLENKSITIIARPNFE